MKEEFYNDVALLAGLSEGDHRASGVIYKVYYPIISKWIFSKGGDSESAQDVFQDGLIVLYQKSKDPEFCLTCKIGTYLFAVCKRLWFKKFQQKYYQYELQFDFSDEDQPVTDALGDEQEDVARFLENEQQYEVLQKAMKELGEPCGQVLKAFYIEKRSMQDIAAMHQYANIETAKVQKYKCLGRLKKIYFKLKP